MKTLEEALLKSRTDLDTNPNKILTLILEDRLEEHPWYYDLIEDQLYGSDSLKTIHGISQDAVSVPYADLFQNYMMTDEDQEILEKMRFRCIQELKKVEFIYNVKQKNIGKTIRLFVKAQPLLNADGMVIAIYGTDRLLETLDSEEMK